MQPACYSRAISAQYAGSIPYAATLVLFLPTTVFATVCRIVHRIESELMQSGMFCLPGKKALLKGLNQPVFVVVDVTETPVERPKRKQQEFYSGKKKRHTLKSQLIINQETGEIICTFFGKGRCHDFSLFKANGIHFHPETQGLHDSGYQGIDQFHSNSYTPQKKT